jgi:CubicO group peptidase (beta-lactamase class C family)
MTSSFAPPIALAKLERDARMKRLHRLLAALSILSLVTTGLATTARATAVASVGDPETLGFSASRLARIAAWQQSQVDAGAFSGAVAAIARNGRIAYLRAVGFRDRAKTVPLQPDAIFWIASMTKPVTSVAAMMLVEAGKLDLAAPVHQYLPELKDMMVGVETKDPMTGKTDLAREPQKRPMTVEDLLRHTAGLVYGVDATKVNQLYNRSFYGSVYRRDKTLADFVSGLAELPLAHQPGEVWDYGLSVDVLSRVIEVASGEPFDQFLQTRLFRPLNMVDTGFYVPEAKLSRLVDPPAGGRGGPPDSVLADVTKPTKLLSGGGGLVSTAADYLRFCQMVLNRGELDGIRILSPATVQRMTTNALPPDIRFAGYASGIVGPQGGSTWGLGFAVRSDAAWSMVPGSVGSFNWMGTSGTYFWVDPAEQLVAVQMIDAAPGTSGPFQRMFRNLTYGAFRVSDQGATASAMAPVNIDAATLAAYAGIYTFSSTSSRDRQVPRFGGLGVDVAMERGLVKVVSPIQGMPAAKAGIMAGDIITHLDDVAIQGLSLGQAIEKMRGPVNTKVRLRIARKGQDTPIEVSLVRAEVRLQGAADLQVVNKDGHLLIEASGDLPVLDFEKGAAIPVVPTSSNEFFVDGSDHTRLAFLRDGAGPIRLVLNPGPWQITGQRIN